MLKFLILNLQVLKTLLNNGLVSLIWILFLVGFMIGIGLEKPNEWAFDTTQFDNILKRLKVVCFASNLRISFTICCTF